MATTKIQYLDQWRIGRICWWNVPEVVAELKNFSAPTCAKFRKFWSELPQNKQETMRYGMNKMGIYHYAKYVIEIGYDNWLKKDKHFDDEGTEDDVVYEDEDGSDDYYRPDETDKCEECECVLHEGVGITCLTNESGLEMTVCSDCWDCWKKKFVAEGWWDSDAAAEAKYRK